MALEVDQGQATGEVARSDVSYNQWVSETRAPSMHNEATWPAGFKEATTLTDLGISRQRLSEWRDVRDAGEMIAGMGSII